MSPPVLPVILYCAHAGSFVGIARDSGSVYRPGMITTRSLLPESVTAGWMFWYVHLLNSAWLVASNWFACVWVRVRWSVGRMLYPCASASVIEACSRFIESGWHTTRVVELLLATRAEARVRAV